MKGERAVDPMLELARQFLATEHTLESKSKSDMEELVERVICRNENKDEKELQLRLWQMRDVRAQDILANVLYQNPGIARSLCELRPELCPEFVRYVVDEARKEWQAEKMRHEWPPKRDLHKLLTEKYKYDVSGNFPDALELSLVNDPKFMLDLADHLKVALPFSLVLDKELTEIQSSRELRLGREDFDAQSAQTVNEISRIHTILNRLPAQDPRRGQYEKRLSKLTNVLNRIITNKQEEHKKGPKRTTFSATTRESPEEPIRSTTGADPSKTNSSNQSPIADSSEQKAADDSSRKGTADGVPYRYAPAEAEKKSLFGLALSGGGIRSATFNLGVVQGMADLDLLRRVDYLSGVSGGAHIAGWLAAWIKREHEGIRRVQRWLSPRRCPDPARFETQPIHFLRKFSNYLTPRKGLFSADIWSMISAWFRNTLLNQIVFTLLLASLLGVPKLISRVFDTPNWFYKNQGWTGGVIILITVGLAVLIGLNLNRFDHDPRPGRGDRRRPSRLWEDFGVHTTIVLGFLILGLVGSYQMWWTLKAPTEGLTTQRFFWGATWIVIFLLLIIAQACGRSWRSFYSQRAEDTTAWRTIGALFATAGTSALSSLAGWGVLYLISEHYKTLAASLQESLGVAEALVLGPVVLICILSLAIMFQIAFLGHNLPDTRREWWNRLGAKLLLTSCLWIALATCAFFGPSLVLWLYEKGKLAVSGSFFFWLATTLIGAWWGRSGRTPPLPTEKETKTTKRLEWITKAVPGDWIARIAPYFYIAGLGILVSFSMYGLTAHVMWGFVPENCDYWVYYTVLLGSPWLTPVMVGLAMLLAWRFGINEFSMHHFYRNRLVRCYLGASREHGTRKPNPFTGFDPEDDFGLSELRVSPPDPRNLALPARRYYGPFPIINTALNLVAGKELAWQERKAASFVFTPLYCGYESRPGEEHPNRKFVNFGYRPTTDYAEPVYGGPSLGTAFAISGAALNPGMGYHSSPAVSFLMALFNLRLGWWLGNTRHNKSWTKSSPGFGLIYLINELIGNTDDTSWFVNLSDGGHFENLGLYELVRRRCKYIIVSDAEEDHTFSLNGLGNAIRRCRTDFGVDIRLDPSQLRPVPGTGKSRTHCAVGDIIYSPDMRGTLVYVKTSLTGDEPGDVLQYSLKHSFFPHQKTIDQFFDESQFESYRALGHHTSVVILRQAAQTQCEKSAQEPRDKKCSDDLGQSNRAAETGDAQKKNEKFLEKMFQYLRAMWYPATENMAAMGGQHSRLYAELLEKFRSSSGDTLLKATRTFFRNSTDDWHPQQEFLVYSMMIELMHRVFEDLELETTADHPHNEGWVSMFREWAGGGHLDETWGFVKGNYDLRFRNFWEFLCEGGSGKE
jgi:hypothetical protein